MRIRVAWWLLAGSALTTAWAGPNSVSMPAVWRFAHPGAKALVGIDWTHVYNSSLGQQVRQQLQASEFGKLEGLELLSDIDKVFVSSPGNPDGEAEEPPAVVALQGRFKMDRLRSLVESKAKAVKPYRGVELYEHREAGQRPFSIGVVNEHTVLLGDTASIRLSIDHYFGADAGQMRNPLFARAAEWEQVSDIWVVARTSPSDFSRKGMEQAQFLNDVAMVEAGLSLRDGLGLQIELSTNTPETAQNLAGGLQMVLGMMLAGGQNQPAMADLSRKLQISNAGNAVKLSLSLEQKELEAALSQVAPNVLASFGANPADVAEMAASRKEEAAHRAAAPPPKRVIRILGLDEGEREIPYPR